jgi:septum site-determining protein MinD
MTRVIGILSGKGGVGKTTLAANLAVELAKMGKEVYAIDCNISTSHLGMYFGFYDYSVTINDVLRGDNDIEDAVYEHKSGVKIIPGSLSPHDLGGIDISLLKKNIKKLVGKADYILLDSAPGLGREAMGTIISSDEVIFITMPTMPSLIDMLRLKEMVKWFNLRTVGLVVNKFGKDYKMTVNDIKKAVDLPILTVIPYDKEVIRSFKLSLPLVLLNPKSNASKKFKELAKLIDVGESEPKSSVLKRLMNFFKF